MQSLTRSQAQLITDIALNNGFDDLEVDTSAGSKKGDNYMGIITCVTLKSSKKVMHLVLKTSQGNAEFRDAVNIEAAFSREVYLYEKVLPELDMFQRECKLAHPFEAYANYYGAYNEHNTESLVMEDIRKLGYGMWNRKVSMNKDHISLVLKEYAKLHSASLALQERKPHIFNEIKQNMFDIYSKAIFENDTKLKQFYGQMLNKVLSIIEGHETATKAIKEFLPNISSYYKYELFDPEYQRVFIHGDCWCNNLMFLYEDPTDPSKPTKSCILDWQLSKCGSPALDLVYFLFCSASKEILRDYKKYLRNYYETFADNLRSAGCDPDKIFPFSLLEKHFKRFAKFGLIMASMNLPIIMCEESEAPDLGSTIDGDLTSVMTIDSVNTAVANQRILDLVLFMVDNDLL